MSGRKLTALAITVLLAVFVAGYMVGQYGFEEPEVDEDSVAEEREPVRTEDAYDRPEEEPVAVLDPEPDKPRVAIVIDDLGYTDRTAEVFESISQELTMAVIPNRPYSEHLYERWKNDFEFIIHMPMEPQGYPEVNPGDNALLTGMSGAEIQRRVRQSFRDHPSAVGMNNHMGSAFTENREAMRHVMRVLDQEGRFFLDSNTSRNSVAPELAVEVGVPVGVNRVFLDNVQDYDHIARQLELLVELALREGEAIGIGHVQFPETARVLAEQLPDYEEDVQFVPVSRLILEDTTQPFGTLSREN